MCLALGDSGVHVMLRSENAAWGVRYSVYVDGVDPGRRHWVVEDKRSPLTALEEVGKQLAMMATAGLPDLPEELACNGERRPERIG